MSGELSSARGFFILARYLTKNMSIKSTIAAVAASPFLLAGAAFAGPYVNVESNISYPDGDYSGATTDLAIGYEGAASEKVSYYVQVVLHSSLLTELMVLKVSSLVRQDLALLLQIL